MKKESQITQSFFIKNINEGNEEAFKILFELYYGKLLYVAQSYVSNKEEAEEIVQDVFVKTWKNRKNIATNINGYLFKSTKNSCLDYLRSKKYKLSKANNIVQLEAFINHKALADKDASSILEKELEQQIQTGIELLPKKCKKVFVKSRIEGLKNREISDELDISIKTVENHMSKAIKHMRLHLREFLSFF
ncbi:RNA polymerase sigma-70 factor (ECF subfamily) [Aquimarina sp. MAR_2010_214]|uniref:RNA polymerase sigma-70 factor n=1 Tax=Aquimarina sp. MAR_2010_214 TaxID=1250026 RepID=UPI000CA8E34C|nr:RNA polymerase sigma-70 factor [Aquimarina sp. MAR_2010_214]PKV51210.1 RNA polymerase sigma-70 factor (ECF subfamily) [Aquimarina sp. MAR_2010_214]